MRFPIALFAGLLLTSTAQAADITVDDPPPDWSGFYVGLFGGYAFGSADGDAGCCSDDFKIGGAQFGGFAGYNFVISNIVAGFEADVGFGDIDGVGFGGGVDDFDISPLSHFRGRAGLALDRALFFVAAGLTLGDGDARIPGQGAPSNLHLGWNAGLGAEYMVSERLAIRAEYIYDGAFAETYRYSGGDLDLKWNASTIRLGAMLRF